MKLYNELYKMVEMPFNENSKFYAKDGHEFVTFGIRASANFSEQYQTELAQQIVAMFNFKEFSTTNMVTFTLAEALDRIESEDDKKMFVYLISKCMCIKRFSGTIENNINLTEKDLRYKKAKFKNMLDCASDSFLQKYGTFIYSAIIDSVEKTVELTEEDSKYHTFAYKLTLIAKEYTDDLVAKMEGRINAGYPRLNKVLLKNRPLESSRRTIERAKLRIIGDRLWNIQEQKPNKI